MKVTAVILCAGLILSNQAFADTDLDQIRAATEKYKDVNVALKEGYIPDPSGVCVSAAMEGMPAAMGDMGIHYINPAMLKMGPPGGRVNGESTHTDFLHPAILLYEPQSDGSLVLVGVENLVWKKSWETAGHTSPPMFNGRHWDYMGDDPKTPEDEAHGFEPHYDQHVWVHRHHPMDDAMPFNPAVKCQS